MFVSRKNLSLIHLIPAEAPARVDITQALHQGVEDLRVSVARSELRQPFAKSRIQGRVSRTGNGTSLLNQVFVGAQSDVLHVEAVYAILI